MWCKALRYHSETTMSRYLAYFFALTSCAQATLSQEPEVCPTPHQEPSSAILAESTPAPHFVVPKQDIFEKDPNNFDDATHLDQCELFGGKISLTKSASRHQAQQPISIKTPTGETNVSCAVSEIEDWDVGVRYQCPGFTWDQIGGEGSTENHLKGKIAGTKIDLRGFVSSSEREALYCSFPHSVYTNQLAEVSKGALLTCPLLPEGEEGSSPYEVSFATTPDGDSAITMMRHGDGDIGMYYAIPCEKNDAGFACEGTLWPLSLYRESPPEPEAGEKIAINVRERAGRYTIDGALNERMLEPQSCMKFSW